MGKFYISIKRPFIGEVFKIKGPYDTFEEADKDLDMTILFWKSDLHKGNVFGDEYIGIVLHKDE